MKVCRPELEGVGKRLSAEEIQNVLVNGHGSDAWGFSSRRKVG